MRTCRSNREQGANKVKVFKDKYQFAATFTALAFSLIGLDACYTGVQAQAEICAITVF